MKRIAILLMLSVVPAQSGELVYCQSKPGKGPFVYRDLEERKCWFPANGLRRGEQKPLEELAWSKPKPVAIEWPKRSLFDERWPNLEDVKGWSHQE